MCKAWFLALAAWLAVAGAATGAGAETRFSRAISPEERAAAGIERLSSDQVAVLDALVRRDLTAQILSETPPDAPKAFSQRLTADERKNSGVAELSIEQRQQLDATVTRLQANGLTTRSLLTPPIFLPPSHASAVRTVDKKKEREIHGSMTLSYGWGEGGYSTKSGTMIMNMTDPDRRYSVTIGYSETHVKGGPAGMPVYMGNGPRYPGDLEYLRP